MTEEEKKVEAPAAEPVEETAAEPAPKKKKKWPIVVGVIVAVCVVAGVGFFIWHEQPSFCNAICHTPMDPYLPTYEAEPGQPAVDKWGNEVSDAVGMMAPRHRVTDEGVTCMGCHVPTLSEQIGEGISWATGNYEVMLTKTGQMVVPEKSLEQLVEARGLEPAQFCLNESCHWYGDSEGQSEGFDLSAQQKGLIQATADLERNPHVPQHGTVECSECHKAHRASVNYCSSCHNDAPIPDGWINAADNKKLEKELEAEQNA